jgi:hypothetical protein
LPQGQRIEFDVALSQSVQRVQIKIDTPQRIRQLRIDVADGPGSAVIENLRLTDTNGKLIMDWTAD